MIGPCRDCPNHKEPPLDPPDDQAEDALTEEDIRKIKADERDEDRRGR